MNLNDAERKEDEKEEQKLEMHQRMALYGQEILLSNASAGSKLEVRLEHMLEECIDFDISNFKAIFEFEYKYQTKVAELRKELEVIGEHLSRENK